MRAKLSPLLLLLSSTLCAQTETQPRSLIPTVAVDPSSVPKPRETVSTRELLVPSRARKELQRSETALLSGDVRSSALHLEKALHISPGYLEAHNNLGSRYFELQEYEKAVVEFQKAINIDPRMSQPYNNLSVALFLLRRYPDAEVAARRALDLDRNNSTARYMLGCILATEQRNPSEAIETLRQTQDKFPDARLLLAQVLLRQGAVNEAKNELRDYLKVPGVEKKQKVECWLARLEQALAAAGCAQSGPR
jgi:Flp pilus assembly protein TadD, contains TPR repeats